MAHGKGGPIQQTQCLSHLRSGPCQHAVEDMVVPLLCRLGTDPGPLQQIVGDMTSHHLMLREREGGREGGREGEREGGVCICV